MALQSIVSSGCGSLGSRVDQENIAPFTILKLLKNNDTTYNSSECGDLKSRVDQETSTTRGDNLREGAPHRHT